MFQKYEVTSALANLILIWFWLFQKNLILTLQPISSFSQIQEF